MNAVKNRHGGPVQYYYSCPKINNNERNYSCPKIPVKLISFFKILSRSILVE